MADLIHEFFERELSETESAVLSEQLRLSADESLRFEGLLESHYLATGLPLPELPASLQNLPLNPGGLSSALSLKLFAVLIAAMGLGYAVYKFWPSPAVAPEAVLEPVVSVSQSQPSAVITKLLPVQPKAVSPTETGEELSVVVGAQEKTLVTVRILNQQGREVRDLYTGFVQPGHWSFQWDGDLSAGVPAPAGDYQIDVQSGALHQTKDRQIKPN
jgi:hypothetical protein